MAAYTPPPTPSRDGAFTLLLVTLDRRIVELTETAIPPPNASPVAASTTLPETIASSTVSAASL